MSGLYFLILAVLLTVLTLAAYVDRVYSEMGKFLAREYQDNIDSWTEQVEPRIRLGSENIALSASVLRQLSLAGIALLMGLNFGHSVLPLPIASRAINILRTVVELTLFILLFGRMLPEMLFTRTRGLWPARIAWLLQLLFYLALPVTLLLGLLLSIVSLTEPEESEEPDHPSEAVDALLEAGEEEGILEESDRELVRSVVEFGDKITRDVMTPRPEMFALPSTTTLEQFNAELVEHAFSRIPVYAASLDHITGIAFAHDLLHVRDVDARTKTLADIQRPAAFVPETKKVNELLREMQREKQHMNIVIDEYGGVAGLVTIEDLLEAIVGNISDEHDEPADEDAPLREPDGSYILPGNFDVSRLRALFAADLRGEPLTERGAHDDDPEPLRIPEHYEAATVSGLVTEIAGYIPHAGEVIEDPILRFEVLEATDRLVERVRVNLRSAPPPQPTATPTT